MIFAEGGVDADNYVELAVLSENPNLKLTEECNEPAEDVNEWKKCLLSRSDFEYLGSCGIAKNQTDKFCNFKINTGINEKIYLVYKVADEWKSLVEGTMSDLKLCHRIETTPSPEASLSPSPTVSPSAPIKSESPVSSYPSNSPSSKPQNSASNIEIPKCSEKYDFQDTLSPYNDITKNHWAFNYVMYLTEKKSISGYADGSFKPDRNISRAELLKIVLNAYKGDINYVDYNKEFTDVSNSDWFSKYVNYGIRNNIIEGYSDSLFMPGRFISRAEAIKIILLASGINIPTTLEKADYIDTPKNAWYTKYLIFTSRNGITQGYKDGRFLPDRAITRAEAVKIIQLIDDLFLTPCNR